MGTARVHFVMVRYFSRVVDIVSDIIYFRSRMASIARCRATTLTRPEEPGTGRARSPLRTRRYPNGISRTGCWACVWEGIGVYQQHLERNWNPLHPFKNARDFGLGRWMMDSGLTKTAIDDYLQKGLDGDHCTSFQSADELWELLENIEFGFGPRSWTSFEIESGTLWTRNILQCIQLLLGHLPFADHTVYGPSR